MKLFLGIFLVFLFLLGPGYSASEKASTTTKSSPDCPYFGLSQDKDTGCPYLDSRSECPYLKSAVIRADHCPYLRQESRKENVCPYLNRGSDFPANHGSQKRV